MVMLIQMMSNRGLVNPQKSSSFGSCSYHLTFLDKNSIDWFWSPISHICLLIIITGTVLLFNIPSVIAEALINFVVLWSAGVSVFF